MKTCSPVMYSEQTINLPSTSSPSLQSANGRPLLEKHEDISFS